MSTIYMLREPTAMVDVLIKLGPGWIWDAPNDTLIYNEHVVGCEIDTEHLLHEYTITAGGRDDLELETRMSKKLDAVAEDDYDNPDWPRLFGAEDGA